MRLKEVKEAMYTDGYRCLHTGRERRSLTVWRGGTTTVKRRSGTETRKVEGREHVDGRAGGQEHTMNGTESEGTRTCTTRLEEC